MGAETKPVVKRPELTKEQLDAGYVVVHKPSIKTSLTASLALRAATTDWDKGYDDGARTMHRRALDEITNEPHLLEPTNGQ